MSTPRTLAAAIVAAAGLTASAAAQEPIGFPIDSNATLFSYSGTSSLGPIVGNPPSFTLIGDVFATVESAAGAGPQTIEFVAGGSALVSPDIDAMVAPFLPGFPSPAQVDITNLTLQFTSGVAAIDPVTGDFTALAVTTALSGTATVTPLVGSASVLDLAGNTSTPQPLSGSVTVVGGVTTITATVGTSFTFTDPGTGTSATVQLDGTIVAGVAAPAGTAYCTAATNTTGGAAALVPSGTASLTEADLVLDASGMPANQFSLFILADAPDFVPGFGGSQGNLCIGGNLYRINQSLQSSGAAGAASLAVPFGQLPPGASIDAGETWYFQTWFRDDLGGFATSNTTNGVEVTFFP